MIGYCFATVFFLAIFSIAGQRENERKARRKQQFDGRGFADFGRSEAWLKRENELSKIHPALPLLWLAFFGSLVLGYASNIH